MSDMGGAWTLRRFHVDYSLAYLTETGDSSFLYETVLFKFWFPHIISIFNWQFKSSNTVHWFLLCTINLSHTLLWLTASCRGNTLTRCGNIVTFQSKPFRFPKNPLRYLISYGISVLTKTSTLLGGNELHAPSLYHEHNLSIDNIGKNAKAGRAWHATILSCSGEGGQKPPKTSKNHPDETGKTLLRNLTSWAFMIGYQ